jgi:hypothetical protein
MVMARAFVIWLVIIFFVPTSIPHLQAHAGGAEIGISNKYLFARSRLKSKGLRVGDDADTIQIQ